MVGTQFHGFWSNISVTERFWKTYHSVPWFTWFTDGEFPVRSARSRPTSPLACHQELIPTMNCPTMPKSRDVLTGWFPLQIPRFPTFPTMIQTFQEFGIMWPTTLAIPGWSIAKPVASSGKILGMGTCLDTRVFLCIFVMTHTQRYGIIS
jgi:hypothetical protein